MRFSTSCVLLQSTRISMCGPEGEETHTHLHVAVVMKDWVCSVSKEAKGLCWGAGGSGMSAQAAEEQWVLAVLCCWGWEEGLAVLQQLSSPATPSQVTSVTHRTELCCKMQPSAFLCLPQVSKHSRNTAGVPHCSGKTALTSSISLGCAEHIEQNSGAFGSLLL